MNSRTVRSNVWKPLRAVRSGSPPVPRVRDVPSLVFGPIVSVAHPELRITPCAKPTMVAPPWKCPLDLVVPKYVTVLMVTPAPPSSWARLAGVTVGSVWS